VYEKILPPIYFILIQLKIINEELRKIKESEKNFITPIRESISEKLIKILILRIR